MNNQEFIDKLSSKVKQIVLNYEYKNPTKNRIIVQITDERTRVDLSYDNKYIIEIKYSPIFNDMEYGFLHEFFHCVQYDEGFPYVVPITFQYHKMASAISSIILDLDVQDRLTKYGYKYNSTLLKESIDTIRKSIIISSYDKEVKQEINEINQYIYICCKIAFIRINYNNEDEVKQLLNIVKQYKPDIEKIQSIIYDSIYSIGYNTPKKVYKFLKKIIRELKLNKFVRISN